MRAHLFREVHLPEFDGDDEWAGPALVERLATAVAAIPVAFTLLWTKGVTVRISSVQVRTGAGQPWRETLTQAWMDDDGEFTHPVGLFNGGDTVQVTVVAMAMDADVPRAAAALSWQPGSVVRQIVPEPPAKFDTMQRGTPWVREGRTTV
jgi:hypothetical protein